MHNIDLILTLTGGLTAALFFGYCTQRIGLSPIVGYLLAGIMVGPNTPGFEADPGLTEQMAEIGVILLMFGVGLNFHFKELLAVRNVAIPGALGQSLVATLLGCVVAHWFGWSWTNGLVFGLAISVASTVVLMRVLADNNDLHTPSGHIAIGWLVVEDLFTVLVLVLLPVVFPLSASADSNLWLELVWSVLKICILVAFVMYVGGRFIPWLLAHIARMRSRELFTLTVLVVALGIAVGASSVFGVSMALGAFLAGMVVGQSDFSSRAASEALPMRDAFAVLFFVSVGMLFNPVYLFEAPLLVAATIAIIMIGKPLAALTIVLGLGYPVRTALSVAVVLSQIGEFSFILSQLGTKLNVLPANANNTLIAAAILSISLNPILYPLVDRFEAWARRRPKLWAALNKLSKAAPNDVHVPHDEEDYEPEDRAIVVGYGPIGRTLVRLFQQNEVRPTVIEMNLDTVHRLRADGIDAIYGDCTHRQTLLEAGAAQSVVMVLSSAGMHGSAESIRLVRELNPDIRVFARASYLREIPALYHAGADAVFASEGEVALGMTEFLLRILGATGEQIDREKDRIRKELFGDPLTIEILLPPPPKRAESHDADPAPSATLAPHED